MRAFIAIALLLLCFIDGCDAYKEGNEIHSTQRPRAGSLQEELDLFKHQGKSEAFCFSLEGKAMMVMPVHKASSRRTPSMATETLNQRSARGFDVAWPAIIRGVDEQGQAFQEFNWLQYLSPAGATMGLMMSLPTGARVEIDIRCPLSRRYWLRYWGRVISVEGYAEGQIISVSFDSTKPAFIPAAAVVRLHLVPSRNCRLH